MITAIGSDCRSDMLIPRFEPVTSGRPRENKHQAADFRVRDLPPTNEAGSAIAFTILAT